jgi:hypothetical protein
VRPVCDRRFSVVFSAVLIARDQSIWEDLTPAGALRVVRPADASGGEGAKAPEYSFYRSVPSFLACQTARRWTSRAVRKPPP